MSRIYVGRLPYQAREKEVERFFRGFGRIRDINLKNGFGFVVSSQLIRASWLCGDPCSVGLFSGVGRSKRR